MDIAFYPSRDLGLAQQRCSQCPFHQDLPLLEVRHLPPLLAQHSLHVRATLSYYFIIQEFEGLHPLFSSALRSHGCLDSKLSLAAQQFATL